MSRIAALLRRQWWASGVPEGMDPHDPDQIMRLTMQDMRRRLRSGAVSPGPTAAERRNRHRFARNKTQERFKVMRRKPAPQMSKALMVAKFKSSPIMDALAPDRARRWVRGLDRVRSVPPAEVKLEDFSFFADPHVTLQGLRKIFELETTELAAQVHFQDDVCVDIGPYMVLAEAWRDMAPVVTGGRMPPPLQKVIQAVGLQRQLRMNFKGVNNHDDVHP